MLSRDGKYTAALEKSAQDSFEQLLYVWETDGGKLSMSPQKYDSCRNEHDAPGDCFVNLTFSHKGDALALATNYNVFIYDLSKQALARTIDADAPYIERVSFVADGRGKELLALSCDGGTLRLFSPILGWQNLRERDIFNSERIEQVALIPIPHDFRDWVMITTANMPENYTFGTRTLHLWETDRSEGGVFSEAARLTYEGTSHTPSHTSNAVASRTFEDGVRLAVADGKAVALWEKSPGDMQKTVVNYEDLGVRRAFAISLGGRYVAVRAGEQAWVINAANGSRSGPVKERDQTYVAVSSDGRYLLEYDELALAPLRVRDLVKGADILPPEQSFLHEGLNISTLRLVDDSNDLRYIAVDDAHSGREAVWLPFAPEGGKALIPLGTDIIRIAFNPDGNSVALTRGKYPGREVEIRKFGPAGLGPLIIPPIKHKSDLSDFRFSNTGRYLLTRNEVDGVKWITLWNNAGKFIKCFRDEGTDIGLAAVAFSPDDSLLAVASGRGGLGSEDKGIYSSTVRVFKTADGSLVRTLNDRSRINYLAFNSTGTYLATAGILGLKEENEVWVWEVGAKESPVPAARIAFSAEVRAITFSPDDRYIVAVSDVSTSFNLWRTADLLDEARSRLAGTAPAKSDAGETHPTPTKSPSCRQ